MTSSSNNKRFTLILGGGALLLLSGLSFFLIRLGTGDGSDVSDSNQEERVHISQAYPTTKGSLVNRAVSTDTAPAPSWSAETQKQMGILDQILQSKNDNDPRLDRELAQLNDETQEAMREKYHSMKMEDRNGRGTVVFLLARYLDSGKNQEFFLNVLQEAPCLSLENCQKATAFDTPESLHSAQAGMDVTLGYPQLVVLQALEDVLSKRALNANEMEILQVALQSPVTSIQRKAEKIRDRL